MKVIPYLISEICPNIFCERLSGKTISTSLLGSDPLQFTISAIFSTSKEFFAVTLDIQSNVDGMIFNFSKIPVSYFILNYNFGIKCQFSWSRVVFTKNLIFFWKTNILLGFSCILRERGSRGKFSRQSLKKYLSLRPFLCIHQKLNV